MTARRRPGSCALRAVLAAAAALAAIPPAAGAGITVVVQASSAPNSTGLDATARASNARWRANALYALERGLRNRGDRQTDPAAYYEVLDGFFEARDIIVTNGKSWRGEAFAAAPFNDQNGNRTHFGLRAFGDGAVQFKLKDLRAILSANTPIRLAGRPSYTLDVEWSFSTRNLNCIHRIGWRWGPDRRKGGGDDVKICESTHPNSEDVLLDELVYSGLGNAFWPERMKGLPENQTNGKQVLQDAIDDVIEAVDRDLTWFSGRYEIVGSDGVTYSGGRTLQHERLRGLRLAPYWRGGGGFVVRPSDGLSAAVRLECAGRRFRTVEHAGEDGLIVRLIPRSRCESRDGRPLEGELSFEGIEGGGWYWINGDRNVAVSPLVVEASLNGGLRPPVPAGVAAEPSGDARFVKEVTGRLYGTLVSHDLTGFIGIVPHLVDLEGEGEHVAPYWKGGGGVVGRPLDGRAATFLLSCEDGVTGSYRLEAGEDGLVVSLLPGCFGGDGEPIGGELEADGLEDGAWYWLNSGGRFTGDEAGRSRSCRPGACSFVAPLLGRDSDPAALAAPLVPGGVEADEGPLGTLFSRGNLMGIVPRVRP